jgi:hypothetical protein
MLIEFWFGNLSENVHLEYRKGDGRIPVRCVTGRQVMMTGRDGTGSGQCPMAGFAISVL